MCAGTLFHVLRKQNISLYAFVSINAVLVKKKGRGIFEILRPFPVSRCFIFSYCLIAGTPPQVLFSTKSADGGRNPPAAEEICLTAGEGADLIYLKSRAEDFITLSYQLLINDIRTTDSILCNHVVC